MIHFGIDIGVSGAAACIDENARMLGLEDLVTMRDGKTKWSDALHLIGFIRETRDGREAHAWVEYVASGPKMGKSQCLGMGQVHGSVLAALQVAGIPFTMVAPVSWKRKLNVQRPAGASDREAKAITTGRARQLFPTAELDHAKDHNRAESLLLAYYGRMTWVGSQADRAAQVAGAAPF